MGVEGSLFNEDDMDNDQELPEFVRARTSPFFELVDFIFKRIQNQDANLPSLPPGLSDIHQEVFLVARDLLQEPGDISKKKDVFVIMGGIINTLSPMALQFTMSSKILSESKMPLPILHLPNPEDPAGMCVESLQSKVFQCLSQYKHHQQTRAQKDKYVVLKILSQILIWLENDKFAQPTSEHVFVSAWSDILNTLFCKSGLRGIPGELGSKASRDSRALTEKVFGCKSISTPSSRKVDMTIRVFIDKKWTEEICIFEYRGLDITKWYPIIAETRGLVIDFYTLRRPRRWRCNNVALVDSNHTKIEDLASGKFGIVFMTPELIFKGRSVDPLRDHVEWQRRLQAVILDEVHCIGGCGKDFRPSYDKVGELRPRVGPKVAFVAVSTTLPLKILQDVKESASFKEGVTVINVGNDRPNIRLEVRTMENRSGFEDLGFLEDSLKKR
ncbi:ATP-dependent DNA helicase sgs1 [Mortierella sp. AD094]|nr:ATP-dependent DNA helicase sgs1 [Mortierella sp. AD094]